jgi:hypothetical protein
LCCDFIQKCQVVLRGGNWEVAFDDKLDDLQEDELDFIIEAVPTGLKGSHPLFRWWRPPP